MSEYRRPNVVSTAELAGLLNAPGVRVLDGSFKLPGTLPLAIDDYRRQHIPGAVFFDIDAIADRSNPLPHMLPSPEAFGAAVGAMGISNDTRVIVYDAPGLMSAGRVWWTFRVFGHDNVAVLNGGLRQWLAEGRPVTAELPGVTPATFTARLRPEVVRNRAQMLANVASRREQVIDARSAGRFTATEPEFWPGRRAGHIPGSVNLPSGDLTDPATGLLLPPEELRRRFENAGLSFDRPVVASCGSGVTASALAFALHLLGRDDVAVYDGSWAEWGLPGDTPVETGPSRR